MTAIPNQHRVKPWRGLDANVECDSTMVGAVCRDGRGDGGRGIGIAQPRVALLNIGEEETKGLDNIREAAVA